MTSKPILIPLLAFFLLAAATTLNAQSPAYTLTAKGLYDGNQVVVRWAPLDFDTWNWANQHNGYVLERITIKDNGTVLSPDDMAASQITLASQLKPVPESQWQTMPDSNLAGIVAGSIYGDSLEVVNMGDASFMEVVNATEARKNRFGFSLFACDQNLDIAKAAGLAFVDTTMAANKEYIYTVRLYNLPSGATERRGAAIVSTVAGGSLPAPPKPKAIAGDSTAQISWDKRALEEHYTSYVLERSDNNGQSYQPASASPIISLSGLGEGMNTYLDTLPQNNTVYVYRVRGVSPFGFLGPPSDTVHVVGEEPSLAVMAEITEVKEINSGTLRVTWAYPANMESVLSRFEIHRSAAIDGEYSYLGQVQPNVRVFTDANPYSANYYMIQAVDINGKYTTSLPILGQIDDTTPPAAPTGLSGACDDAGTVTVSWLPNSDGDVFGYRVYMSDQTVEDTSFVEVTGQPVRDTFFRFPVNLQSLTEQLFVLVKAVDFRENTSASSVHLNIQKADIIPPSPPSITRVVPMQKAVRLDIAPSTSADIVRYQIQIRPLNGTDWGVLAEYQTANMVSAYIDTVTFQMPIRERRWWEYRILAFDDADQVSSSQVVRAKPLDQGIRDAVQNFAALYTPAQLGVALTWNYNFDVDLVGFQIYRAIDTSRMRMFKFVPPTVTAAGSGTGGVGNFSYLDTDIKIKTVFTKLVFLQPAASAGAPPTAVSPTVVNQPISKAQNAIITLRYQIMAVFADGAQSPLTPEVQVQIQ